ncbi:MAG: hypothetical protein II951_02925 [Bacteroidales bacterium]|nr:hypothetical protein [Bacteroidales bacterium]
MRLNGEHSGVIWRTTAIGVVVALLMPMLVRCQKEDVIIKKEQEKPKVQADSLITVRDRTAYSATIEGIFFEDAKEDEKIGIKFSLQNNKYIRTAGIDSVATWIGNGRHRVELSGLYTDTTYYFCTYRTKGDLTTHSDVMSFRTTRVSVVTDSATDIYAYGAQLGLRLSEPLDKKQFRGRWGVFYSTRPRAIREYSAICDSILYSDGLTYAYLAKGMRAHTTYYYKAFIVYQTAYQQDVYVHGDCLEMKTAGVGVETRGSQDIGVYDARVNGYANVYFRDMEDYGFLIFTRPREVTIDSVGSKTTDQKIWIVRPDKLAEKGRGEFSAKITGLDSKTRYFFRAFARNTEVIGGIPYTDMFYGKVDTLQTAPLTISTEGDVDLGLSVLWSAKNVGASKETEIGTESAFSNRESIAFAEGERLPTSEEAKELVDSCVWTWITLRKQPGVAITGKNGNSIFLPATRKMEGANKYVWGAYMVNGEVEANKAADTTYYFVDIIRFGADEMRDNQAAKTAEATTLIDFKTGVRPVRDKQQ